MRFAYGDSYGGVAANELANNQQLAGNYFASLAARRANEQAWLDQQARQEQNALQWEQVNQRARESAVQDAMRERQFNYGVGRDNMVDAENKSRWLEQSSLGRDRFNLEKRQMDMQLEPTGQSRGVLNQVMQMYSKGGDVDSLRSFARGRLVPMDENALDSFLKVEAAKELQSGQQAAGALNDSYRQFETANPVAPYNSILPKQPWQSMYAKRTGVDPLLDPNFSPEAAAYSAKHPDIALISRHDLEPLFSNGDKEAAAATASIFEARAKQKALQSQLAQQFLYDSRKEIPQNVQTTFDSNGRPVFAVRGQPQGIVQPQINPANRTPYPDGTRLQRKDGSIYVVRNGQPVLE